ncbi:MAG: MBG domain-containing protein [Vicinamibacterales bacterium]
MTRLLVRVLVLLTALPPQVLAQQVGGQVTAGDVTIAHHGSQLTLDQASKAAIVNWQQFNIAPQELVRVLQPGADAAMLARVLGDRPSELLGRLQADGRFFLINPRGVIVGRDAVIDTAAFLASTLDVADHDFLAGGPLTFAGDGTAGILNLGRIVAREGNVWLLAHTVSNEGIVSAANGGAVLAAGTDIVLASPDLPSILVRTNLRAGDAATGVENTGVIEAAQARLEAAGGGLYDLAINQAGVVRATGAARLPDGRVVLTAAGGDVAVTGSLAARDADGSGGEILVGGDYQGRNPDVANAARTYVASTARLDARATATVGDGGRIIVWADGRTRFDGALDARGGADGGDGGFAEVSGKDSLTFAGTADLSAPNGAFGALLLDPTNIEVVAGVTAPLPADLQAQPFLWDDASDPGNQTLGADSIETLLLTANVTLEATSTITVNEPITVAAGGAADVTLRLQAPTIAVNQSISLANVTDGTISLSGSGASTSVTTAAAATLTAGQVDIVNFPITTLNGAVTADRLSIQYPAAPVLTSVTATNAGNAIDRLVIVNDEADPDPLSFTGNVAVHSGSAMEVAALIDDAGDVTVSSAGNLTMLAAGALTNFAGTQIGADGAIKLASTEGVFINQAGTGVLAGTARRLLYTSSVDGAFSLGGLSGYTQVINVSFPNDPNGGLTRVLYLDGAGTPTLTITANDFIRSYGDDDPTFTASFAGGTSADLTVQPGFTVTGGPAVNAGTYTIVPSGAASNTHNIAYVNGTLTVRPRVLTYTANPATRTYGEPNPAFSGSVTGFVGIDTVQNATTGSARFTTSAVSGSRPGRYEIVGSGLTANNGNYVFEQAVGNFTALTVDPAPLTVSIDTLTRTYGSPNPAFNVTFSGLRNGDRPDEVFTFGTSATTESPVGRYPIVISAEGPAARNYHLTAVTPGEIVVTPAPLDVFITPISWTYGDELRPFPVAVVLGTVLGQSPGTAVRLNNPTTRQSPAGTYTVGVDLLTANYEIRSLTGGTITINPRPLTVVGGRVERQQFEPLTSGPVTLVGVNDFDQSAAMAYFTVAVPGVPAKTPPGTYSWTPAPADGATFDRLSSYIVTYEPGTLTIVPNPFATTITSSLTAIPNELNTVTSTTTDGPETVITADDLEFDGLDVNSRVEIVIGGGPLSIYREVFTDAVDRLRADAANDAELRQSLEDAGLLDLLESGDNAEFLADIDSNATKQGALLGYLETVLLDYAQRPRESVPAYITTLLDILETRTREQKTKEARLLVEKFDNWVEEQRAFAERTGGATQLTTLFGGATAPDFVAEVRAELLAAAITTGAVSASLAAAATVATVIAAATVAKTAAGTATSMLILSSLSPGVLAAGPAAIVIVGAVTAAVRAFQVFEEAAVLDAVAQARAFIGNPDSVAVNYDNEDDRLSFTTALYEYINEKGY